VTLERNTPARGRIPILKSLWVKILPPTLDSGERRKAVS
jgi:hypothetical protein